MTSTRAKLVTTLRLGVRGQTYLFEVESLRGLAVLLVFVVHLRGMVGQNRTADSDWDALLLMGNTGVTLFFVISGFLLSRPWLQPLFDDAAPTPNLKHYALARAARILPLYYLVILVAAVQVGAPDKILPAMAFQPMGNQLFPYSPVWWSLVTEMQFYLVLPILGALLLGGRWGHYLLGALFLAWLGLYCNFVAFADGEVRSFTLIKSLFARLPAFLMGMGVASLYLHPLGERIGPRTRVLVCAVGLGVLTAVLLPAGRLGAGAANKSWPVYHAWEGICWGLVMLALVKSQPAIWRLPLVNLPLALLGKISYSVYLWHLPILFYVIYPATKAGGDPTQIAPRSLAAILLVLLVSTASYLLIERPLLRLKERLSP